MTADVCTLFEGDYHYGVAALLHSLHNQGFKGRMFAGYRGALPTWAGAALPFDLPFWPGASVLKVSPDCSLYFLPLATSAHFTNIKPDFMLDLFAQEQLGVEGLLYLDPDICLVRPWQFVADWLSCGVTLCEDVNSPMSATHPRRIGWQRYFAQYGITLNPSRSDAYVNGGCVGVSRAQLQFLENWKLLGQHMAEAIGGLSVAKLTNGQSFSKKGFANCFDCSDQDVLNAAITMTSSVDCSVLPKSAMGFSRGDHVLPHALGPRKPWRRRYVREALAAWAPTAADKAFWKSIEGPLNAMPDAMIARRRRQLSLATLIARFYRR